MHKYFDLLLELLWPEEDSFVLDEKKKLSAAATKIEERWDKKLQVSHKVWFIFTAYEDLLNEKITLDEFLATWDINSKKDILQSDSSMDVLNGIIQWKKDDKNTLYILDSISFATLSGADKKIIQDRVKNHDCELVFC